MKVLNFVEGGKPENPEKTLGAGREPTKNSTHMRRPVRELNPGHRGGRRAFIHFAIRARHRTSALGIKELPYTWYLNLLKTIACAFRWIQFAKRTNITSLGSYIAGRWYQIYCKTNTSSVDLSIKVTLNLSGTRKCGQNKCENVLNGQRV